MITKQQANEILVLASNYTGQIAATTEYDSVADYNMADKYDEMSKQTWLKLKELVDSLAVPSDEVESITEE